MGNGVEWAARPCGGEARREGAVTVDFGWCGMCAWRLSECGRALIDSGSLGPAAWCAGGQYDSVSRRHSIAQSTATACQ